MTSFFLHLLIALTWLFLSEHRDLPRMLIGLVVGWAVLALFQPLLPPDRYLKSSMAFFKWLWSFIKAFLIAQYRVAQSILLPQKFPVNPGFLDFPIGELNDFERIVLSHTISLTPGTTSVEIDETKGLLVIHALDASDPEGIRKDIRDDLLEPLLKVTRP